MYSIASIIYGVPLTKEVSDKIDEYELRESEKWSEQEDGVCGFRVLHHGMANKRVGFSGVDLDSFSDADDFVDLSTLNFKPTIEQVYEAGRLVEALDPELRELCPPIGVYVVWSTQ